MTTDTTLNSVTQIFDLLKAEREALLSGDVDALQEITAQKQAWVEMLPEAPLPLDLDQIRKIKALSEQNLALSDSCQAAQKSVIQRLSEIRKIQKTMGIYAVDGKFCDSNDPPPNIESRA